MGITKKLDGLLLIDKPLGLTSHDVVARVRRVAGQKEVGHTGTLDPLATGLLVVCLGKATKISQFLSEADKEYEATIRLGVRSTTFDAEGVDETGVSANAPELLDSAFCSVLNGFLGEQDQQVPPYASVRLNGRHMYDLAREGETMERPVRRITISSLDVLTYQKPDLTIRVKCTKGTYIRALANDIGERLGCGGYLAQLRRTSAGRFHIQHAVTLEQLESLQTREELESRVLPIADALEFSSISLAQGRSEIVSHGRIPLWQDVQEISGLFRSGDKVLLKDAQGGALAVGIAGADSRGAHNPSGTPIESYVRVLV